ncbi:MAG: glycerophosphodiester phosphodiesterase [Acidobacteriaceae bacterium]|jgi:glycerophosphoryl diester phosphodiesterase|nr:glycerophosphodiester phosphodiesterase [Acidobacteriaceae bacterium]
MRHAFFASPHPLVFAHRGGAGLAPENTLAAFDHATQLGVDGFELDVRLSRDGVVVVHHDATLERTTPLSGAVSAYTAAELRDAGVPALGDVLERYDVPRLIVELKVDEARFAEATLSVVRECRAEARVCLGAFGVTALRAIRRRAPEIACSAAREEVRWALYRSWVHWPFGACAYHGFQVPERAGAIRVVSPRFVRAAHAAGLGVQVWTVNHEDAARRLLSWGVDALITDRPDLIGPIVRAHQSHKVET